MPRFFAYALAAAVAALVPPANLARGEDLAATAAASAERLEKILAGEPPASVDDLRAMEERFRSIARKVVPATVGVRVGGAQGSGVIVSEEGLVLTAGHVSGRAGRDVTVIFHDGRQLRGKTLGGNFGIDSGMIQITEDGTKWPHVELGASESLAPGQWCLATGHPGGFQSGRAPPVRIGRILRNRRSGITSDCLLIGGDSGGPLFDMEGRLIGIHSRIGESFSANIHVPVDTYRETWDRLVKGETWGRGPGGGRPPVGGPYLGVIADPEADDCRIGTVVADGPAQRGGLQPGDVIAKFDGKDVEDFDALADEISRKEPGDEVVLEVRREASMLSIKVTLGAYGEPRSPSAPEAPARSLEDPPGAPRGAPPAEDPPAKPPETPRAEDERRDEERERSREEFRRRLEELRRRQRERTPRPNEKNHASVLAAFRAVVKDAARGTVAVFCDGKQVALGALIDTEGHVVTKASEVRGEVRCRLYAGRELPAAIVAVSEKHDVALLSLSLDPDEDVLGEAQPIEWSAGAEPEVGSLLATAGPNEDPLAIGVVSVAVRPLHQRGVLGISFPPGENAPRVSEVFPDTGASRAGLKPGDLILSLDGTDVASGADVVELLKARAPGDVVRLRLRRGEEEVEVTATLGSLLPDERQQRFERMNLLGGERSQRHSNFPAVFQHDTVLFPQQCGGPLVGLDGKAVGLNIARAGRVDSFALPAGVVRLLVEELKSARSLPSVELARRLSDTALEKRIVALEAEVAQAERDKAAAEAAAQRARAALEELRKEKERRAAAAATAASTAAIPAAPPQPPRRRL